MKRNIILFFALFLLQPTHAQLFKTTVKMEVQSPPKWNTEGMKRIAVIPFENNYSGRQYDIASHLTNEALNLVSGTGHFTVISASQVENLRRSGENLANHVDVLLTGKIVSIESKDGSSTYKGVTTYSREVKLTVSYSLEQTRDGSLIGSETKSGSRSDRESSSGKLKSTNELLQQIKVLSELTKNLVPYTVNESRALMGDKTQGKELNERMKTAQSQVKAKNYRTALNMYMKIYDEYNSFPAIYNACIMHEALGDITAAIDLMVQAVSETGNQNGMNEIARLNRIKNDRDKVQQHNMAEGPIDKVIRYASNEALKHLPSETRASCFNNSILENDLASRVIEGMTAAFRQRGDITIVDRENIQRVENELQMQNSGMVSDDNILNMGRLVGANIIVTVEISGVGSMRRLKMKILDIEGSKVLFESDGSSNWEL